MRVDIVIVAHRVFLFWKLIALFSWKEAEKYFGMRQTWVSVLCHPLNSEPCDLEHELFHFFGPQFPDL